MEHLYLDGYIKIDKIPQALHAAKIKGLLSGVDDPAMRDFSAGFDRVRTERHGEFLDKLDHNEVEKIIHLMGENHSDHLYDSQLQTIAAIILNKNFQF